jgi:4-amino-4-deoxy-L-arabinose transferase-like glycosyltransferase
MCKRLWPKLALAVIVGSAAALAMVWVFRVPIYMAPDEPMNLDYALAIQAHGGLFRVRNTCYADLPATVHPYSAFLLERTNAQHVAFHPGRKMPSGYGTRAYFTVLDRDAPAWTVQIDQPNKPFAVYPFGYYALLAMWLEVLRQLNDKPVFLFFGARILSVLLFAGGLILSYGTLRRLGRGIVISLLVTTAIAFFPLSTSVASAIQMDNLSFFLIALGFNLALLARQRPDNLKLIAGLGLTFAALLVTKPHFFLCALIPVALMLAAEMHGRRLAWTLRLKAAAVLLLPALAAGSLYLWTIWGCENYYFPAASESDPPTHHVHWFGTACWDFYAGLTHETFWSRFGWHDLIVVIRSQRTNEVIQFIVQLFSWVLLALTLLRLEQVISRLGRLAWRGRPLLAARLALSNPAINCYFLFTLFMFWLYIRTDNRFGAQGRNWWPLILPIFLTAIGYAPRALSLRRARMALSSVVLLGLLAYCALGSVYSLRAIERRYYPSERDRSAVLPQVARSAGE